LRTRHERLLATSPEQVWALLMDLECVWPTEIGPAPRPQGDGLYRAGPMLWQEFRRVGAARAFRVVSPEDLRAEHWFDERLQAGSLVRHTVEGEASGEYEAIWREQISPYHDRVLEAFLDNIETALAHPALSSLR
jgi:hypothetical protein